MALKDRLNSIDRREVAVCSVVKAELAYGAIKSLNPEQNFSLQQEFLAQFYSFPFDDFTAITFGAIRGQLETQGTPIGPCDLQIVAIALVNDLTLVTHNVREFVRVEGLRVEDWEV